MKEDAAISLEDQQHSDGERIDFEHRPVGWPVIFAAHFDDPPRLEEAKAVNGDPMAESCLLIGTACQCPDSLIAGM